MLLVSYICIRIFSIKHKAIRDPDKYVVISSSRQETCTSKQENIHHMKFFNFPWYKSFPYNVLQKYSSMETFPKELLSYDDVMQ